MKMCIRDSYEGIDPLTGYKIGTVFSDGTLTGLQTNTKEEACAIAQAHRATSVSYTHLVLIGRGLNRKRLRFG